MFNRLERVKLRIEGNEISSSYFNYRSPDLCRLVERAMDVNGDGRLTAHEYVRCLLLLSSPPDPESRLKGASACKQQTSASIDSLITELFRFFDADGNGYISRDEVRLLFAEADKMKNRPINERVSR